jgi:hypothetical protein
VAAVGALSVASALLLVQQIQLPTGAGQSPAATSAVPAAEAPASPSTAPASPRAALIGKPAWRPSSSAELPPGPPVPATGTGSWRVVPGTSPVSGTGPLRTYTAEVEGGVTVPEGDAAFAAAVQATLADPRSWIADGAFSVQRIGGGRPSLRIRLTSQQTARAVCGFSIRTDVSCRDGRFVYLSAARWIRGAVAYGANLTAYRQYMVNHETGHFFGNGHEACPAHGGPAPVMMQQTFSVSNNEILKITAHSPQGVAIPRDGKVCAPNPWPRP